MCHPNTQDRPARESMLAPVQHETEEGRPRRRAISREEVRRQVRQCSSKASVAGGLLLTRLQLQLNGYKPTFNQAQPLVLDLLPRWEQPTGADWSKGVHIGHRPRSRPGMLAAWSHFRPAAHLWAAMIYGLQSDQGDIWVFPPKRLPIFLAYANCFLRMGCALPSPQRAGRFALVRSEAWRFGLPEQMSRTVRLEALPLSAKQQQILNA